MNVHEYKQDLSLLFMFEDKEKFGLGLQLVLDPSLQAGWKSLLCFKNLWKTNLAEDPRNSGRGRCWLNKWKPAWIKKRKKYHDCKFFFFFFRSRLLPETRSPGVGPASYGYRDRHSNTWHDALQSSKTVVFRMNPRWIQSHSG